MELARKSIAAHLETGNPLNFQTSDAELCLKRGCFVTLRKHGTLRGCIGTFDTSEPLYQHVIRMSAASAFQDTRFSPVTKSELGGLRIEISVLGPLEKVSSAEEIEIGRHGVYVKRGAKSGTFLPEVAVEQHWGPAEFVNGCAREKAFLTPAELPFAEIFRYEVEKFSE